MRRMVRRGGISALAMLATASLVSTSTALAGHASGEGRTLKLRVPEDAPVFHSGIAAWVLGPGIPEPLRAAHALSAEATMGDEAATGGRVVPVTVVLGRAKPEHVLTNASTVGD